MRTPLPQIVALLLLASGAAAVPPQLNYQGRVAADGVNFDGPGLFKFALVDAAGSITYWSNDNSSVAGSAPATAVSLAVSKGLYAVLLGDASLSNMQAVPSTVFDQADVRLRVWFNDGVHGFQLLTPDQRLASSGYAMRAANVENGAITSNQLASGAVGTAQLAPGAVGTSQLAPGALVPPLTAVGSTVSAVANTAYSANSAALSSFVLPTTANVGDVVTVNGTGSGGWSIGAWSRRDAARNWRSVALSADGTKQLVAVSGGFLYTSTDGGAQFTQRATSQPWRAVASSPDGTRLLAAAYAASPSAVFVSTDSGVSFQQIAVPGSPGWFTAVAIGNLGGKLSAVSDGGGAGSYLYFSTDAGASWFTDGTLNNAPRFWTGIANSLDGLTSFASDRGPNGSGGRIWVNLNGTSIWTARASNRNWAGVACSTNGAKAVAVVNGGQIFTSTDTGTTWTARESSRAWVAVTSSSDGSRLAAVVDSGQIYASTDSGVTWTAQESNRSWTAIASSANGLVLTASVSADQLYGFGNLLSGGLGAVGAFQYAGNGTWTPSVVQGTLAAGSVTSAQLVAGAVGTAQLAAGAVGPAQIAPGAVGTAQLAGGAVGPAQLAPGAVGTNQLAAGAVGSAQIADGAVGSAKLASFLNVYDLTVGNHLVLDGANASGGTSPFPGLSFGSEGSGEGISSKRTAGTGQNGLTLFTNSVARLSILNGGNVGIGTTNPTLAKLQVAGAVSTSLSFAYFNQNAQTGVTAGAVTVPLSIYASDRIAGLEFNAFSDARIKTITGPSDNAADLGTLRQIQVTDYVYKDRVAKGSGRQKKVIAQQVEAVFPQAVSQRTDVVPDIYRAADLRAGWIELATDLRVGERVRLIAEEAEGIFEVLEVREGAFRSSYAGEVRRVFVYGREVNDFRSVDYDALSMLHVSATQELARRLEAREAEVAVLQQRLAAREAADQEREARLARLERLLAPALALQPGGNSTWRRK